MEEEIPEEEDDDNYDDDNYEEDDFDQSSPDKKQPEPPKAPEPVQVKQVNPVISSKPSFGVNKLGSKPNFMGMNKG